MDNLVIALAAATDGEEAHLVPPPAKKARVSRGKKANDITREKRLEQNRKAAIESRRRKKVMVSFTQATGRRGVVSAPLMITCSGRDCATAPFVLCHLSFPLANMDITLYLFCILNSCV